MFRNSVWFGFKNCLDILRGVKIWNCRLRLKNTFKRILQKILTYIASKLSKGKIKMVLNTILPLEQGFFTFLVLIPLKYFDVYKLDLPFLEKHQL